jgi:hypothetical protein
MKKSILILGFFTFIFLLSSCDDDFLESPTETSSVSPEIVFGSKTGAEAHMAGILRRSRAQFSSTDTGGLYSIFYARTVKGNDIIQRATWYLFDYDNDNREPGYRRTTFNWEFPYFMINQVNIFIKGVSETDSLGDSEKDELLAQGYAIRAFYYFQLAMEFQHTYSYDSSLPAPPIYTEPTGDGKPMSTLQELYDFIISDLEKAVSIGVDYRIDKSFVNIDVINAIAAQVYLVLEDWEKAETAANNARENYPLNASEYTNGFVDFSADEWIWAMPQSADQTSFFWAAPHSQADHTVSSYQGTFFNLNFVNLFSPTDVRNLFSNGYGVPDDDYRARITSKFSFSTFEHDIPIIRSPEMILIEAEAKARQGDDDGAATLLYELQLNRDPNAVQSGNTGSDLIEEVLVERRKELYAEIGVEWFDAKRLRRGIPRDGNHRLIDSDLQPDDLKFFLKIPQDEIDANEFIDDSVNENR